MNKEKVKILLRLHASGSINEDEFCTLLEKDVDYIYYPLYTTPWYTNTWTSDNTKDPQKFEITCHEK